MTDARTIAAALGLRRSGAVYGGTCPACDYAGAFTVRETDGRTLFRCHVGCDQSDVVAALRRRGTWGGRALSDHAPRPVARDAFRPERRNDAARVVARILGASGPPGGTLVDVYLRTRGITVPPSPAIRFVPNLRHVPTSTTWPAMVARVEDVTGRTIGVHRTYLRHDGRGKAPVEPAKMTLGAVRGGAVRLGSDGPHLIVGEGIESTLSAMQPAGLPGWAALSAGGIRSLELPAPPVAVRVTIAADADPVGLDAANDAAGRWHAEGRDVRIAMPPAPFTDWNDALRAEVAHDAA